MNLFRRCLLIVAALLISASVLAQNTTARLQGAIRDASGPLPGITVTAVNTESGLQRSAVTDTDGTFILILAPGPYTVTAGGTTAFEEQKTALRLGVGQTIESNFEMKPGKMSAAVAVSVKPQNSLYRQADGAHVGDSHSSRRSDVHTVAKDPVGLGINSGE